MSIEAKKFLDEKMLAKNNRYILSYKKGKLFVRNSNDRRLVQKLKIHKGYKSIPMIERILRYEPRVAVAIAEDVFLFSDHGAIYKYDIGANIINPVHYFRKGMNNPLAFCVRKDEKSKVIEILYGEYVWNTEKGPISIYRYNLKEWEKVYTFQANTVKHIHNIVYDKFKNRYIILTGDENSESALWETSIDFSDVKMIVGGSQSCRACVAYPTAHGIYFATDTPIEQNWLCFVDDGKHIEKICKIPGPCIYGRGEKKKFYLATSVEGDPSLSKWKYRLSNKLGNGVRDRKVHIMVFDREKSLIEVGQLKKDWLPMWLFQFGNAQFPYSSDGKVYFTTQSTKEKGTYVLLDVNVNRA